ncbi:MAG TPA: heparinase II/III family protein [Opitutaceae bacterium]|nr:heparinase II/III family protein [Opitutaceae bacterium]
MKTSFRFLAVKSVAVVICAAAGVSSAFGEYAIGSTKIPEPVIQTESAFRVYDGHPRLFFRDTDLAAIRSRVAGDYAAEWKEMRAMLEERLLSQSPEKYASSSFLKSWQLARQVAFVAVVSGDEKYREWSLGWARALVREGPANNDDELRGRLQCMALAYDWLYPWLSKDERHQLQENILAHLTKGWRFATYQANYVSGHSRWGNAALATGLLAIVTERPEVREKLLVVRKNWVDGYFPTQGWIANEGGYHMGWAYSSAYLTGDIHCLWSSATNDCVYFPWETRLPLFWIYGRQGNGLYANTGDAYTLSGDFSSYRMQLVIAAGILKDRRARWLLPPSEIRFDEILYGDKHVEPLAPDAPQAPLPLARNFGHAGVVIARDRWDEGTTLLQFRSVPFYSSNHHHRDENSFTIDYRGPLAIDSGVYDETDGSKKGGYSGPHWLNYFTRTIAHNAITVRDPAQQMKVSETPVTNDGGQIFREEPTRLKDLLPGGSAHLDGITHFRDTADYTLASGDATKAYDATRVRLAQRDIVYLRNTGRPHPIIVVFDRVQSTQPAFEKRFLLHTVNEPVVHDRLTVTENHGARLSCLTLLPSDAKLMLVGGPGKEAWVDGANHPWVKSSRRRQGLEPGAWRLEVSPGAPRELDYFLNVLFVDDATAAPVTAGDAKLVQDSDQAVVQVAGWRIAFPFAAGAEPRIERAK